MMSIKTIYGSFNMDMFSNNLIRINHKGDIILIIQSEFNMYILVNIEGPSDNEALELTDNEQLKIIGIDGMFL